MYLSVRYLSLLAALLTAFPAGWCCNVLRAGSEAGIKVETSAAPHESSCCSRARTPADHPRPERGKTSPGGFTCECCRVEATRPQGPEAPPADLGPVPALLDLGIVPSAVPASLDESIPLGSSPPRNVLHCVWLC